MKLIEYIKKYNIENSEGFIIICKTKEPYNCLFYKDNFENGETISALEQAKFLTWEDIRKK